MFLESRYVSREHYSFTPKTTLNSAVIKFKLDPWASPSLYDLQDTLIFIKGRIVDSSTNEVPAENARVSVVQNIISSLWSRVEVKLNGVTVTPDPTNFHYKSYLVNLISYNNDVKRNLLRTGGWFNDTPYEFEGTNENRGWMERRKFFGTQTEEHSTEYPHGKFHWSEEPQSFIGKLHTDMITVTKG